MLYQQKKLGGIYTMQQLWLITLPNNRESPDSICETLRMNVQNSRFHRFEVPSLVVGTLDSLMALSDDLSKINSQVENVVRKVERQYLDVSGPNAELLRINSSTVESYLRNFVWDFARYQHSGRQLVDLVAQIQTLAAKVDEELKKLSTVFNDKTQLLASLQRKKTINLITSDFEDFLSPEAVARLEILKAEGEGVLETLMVVVTKQAEQEFLRSYESAGSNIVTYPGSVPGSPVVPGSAKKVYEEGDSVMYSIVVLKHHYTAGKYENDVFLPGTTTDFLDPIKAAFREMRCVIREFSYDGNKSGGIEGQIEVAKQQANHALSTILRWCQVHYGEIYAGWIHLKVIRGFVESVLRYGLPVNFVAMFMEPNMSKEKQIKASLINTISQLRPELAVKKSAADEEEDEDDTDHLPFVCQRFTVIGCGSSNN